MNIEQLETRLEEERQRILAASNMTQRVQSFLRRTSRMKPTKRLYKVIRRMLWEHVKTIDRLLAGQQSMIDAISLFSTATINRAVKAECHAQEMIDCCRVLLAENERLKSKLEGRT
jgi:uncharacterized protein YhaN